MSLPASRARLNIYHAALREIANEDFRGNRPHSATRAEEALIEGRALPPDTETEVQVYAAFYYDFSSVVIFATEIEALRYAVEHSMHVLPVEYGTSLHDQARDAP